MSYGEWKVQTVLKLKGEEEAALKIIIIASLAILHDTEFTKLYDFPPAFLVAQW